MSFFSILFKISSLSSRTTTDEGEGPGAKISKTRRLHLHLQLLLLLVFSRYKLTNLGSSSTTSCCHLFLRLVSSSASGGLAGWCGAASRGRASERGREREEGERLLARNSNNTFFKRADGKFQRILPSSLLMIRLLQIYDSLHEFPPARRSLLLSRSLARHFHSLTRRGRAFFPPPIVCLINMRVFVFVSKLLPEC